MKYTIIHIELVLLVVSTIVISGCTWETPTPPPGPSQVWILEPQDGANLPRVQAGMKASKKGTVTQANYQEIRIRHFHQTLDKYLNA